jgi:TPR repeat protein
MDNTEQLQLGVHAFMGFRFEEARDLLLPLAEAGEVEAQKLVARLYFSGNGVEKSKDKYQYWLEQAAEQGDRQSKAKLKRLKKKNNQA